MSINKTRLKNIKTSIEQVEKCWQGILFFADTLRYEVIPILLDDIKELKKIGEENDR